MGTTLLLLLGCGEAPSPVAGSLYASVEGIDGVYFYPPLGPEPVAAGEFDGSLLDGLAVSIEADADDGSSVTLATFDAGTTPAVSLLAAHERYFVNIPAATYVTNPSRTYHVRAWLDGSELGRSTLSPHVFEVLTYAPALPIGVHLRIEGSGAVRAARRVRTSGVPRHCTDGVRNKDETGIDCGGSCAPCPCSSTGSRVVASAGWSQGNYTGNCTVNYCAISGFVPGGGGNCPICGSPSYWNSTTLPSGHYYFFGSVSFLECVAGRWTSTRTTPAWFFNYDPRQGDQTATAGAPCGCR